MIFDYSSPTTPKRRIVLVWAVPRSLATTCGITVVFSSSGYLDVSVHRVSLLTSQHNWSSTSWVFPFGHLRITSNLPIPAAYRSLSRPSSPLRAKASPIRPSLFSSVSRISFARKPIIRNLYDSFTTCQRTSWSIWWEEPHCTKIYLRDIVQSPADLLINATENQSKVSLKLSKKTFYLLSCLQVSMYLREWRITDSNRWPPACKAGALASWANPPCCRVKQCKYK